MLSDLLMNPPGLMITVLSVTGSFGPPVGQRPEGRILPFSSPAGCRGRYPEDGAVMFQCVVLRPAHLPRQTTSGVGSDTRLSRVQTAAAGP